MRYIARQCAPLPKEEAVADRIVSWVGFANRGVPEPTVTNMIGLATDDQNRGLYGG
jgi:hypothetical protein